MKRIILLIIVFVNIVYHTTAQIEISSNLKDSISSNFIEFASISVKNKNIGTYSDASGKFTIKGLYEFDTIIIRHITYKTLYIPVNEIKQNNFIYLQPQTIPLEEVLVKPNKYSGKMIWTLNSQSKSTFTGFSGFELGTFVYSKIENSLINEIIIKTKKSNKAGEYYVKLHLYHINNGKPSDEILLSKNIFVLNAKTKNIRITIENENIRLPNTGIFVSLEWVGKKENNGFNKNITTNLIPQVIVTDKRTSNKTIYRFWNMDWHDFSELLNIKNANIIIGVNLQIQK